MRRAGQIVGSTQGVLVVRSVEGSEPSIGDRVVDEHLDSLGRIVDVFGPLEQPYVAVSPENGVSLEGRLGSILYIPSDQKSHR